MNSRFVKYLLLFSLLFTQGALFGCAPEEEDLIPPGVAFDAGLSSVVTPTTSTTASLSGTMDPDATIVVDVTTGANVTNLVQDPVLGTWSFDLDSLVEGENIVLVSASDAVGNIRTTQLSIVVDLTGPTTTIDQYPVVAQPGPFNFAGTVTELDSTVFVEIHDSTSAPVASGSAAIDADIWSVDLDLSLLPNDTYTVTATGTDRLGNIAATPTTQEIVLDVASPSFAITTPATLPIILADPINISDVSFAGSSDPGNTMTVVPSSTLTPPDGVTGLWDASFTALGVGNTVMTFDVNAGGTIQKVLVVREQTAPLVVQWNSPLFTNQIEIQFNEAMNPLTIDAENLLVEDSTETAVTVNSVTAGPFNEVFTFDVALLTVGETYKVTLQTTDSFKVEDSRGNSLASTYVWTFKKL